MTLKNNRGQALIESLAVFITVVAALSGIGGLLYFALVHVGVNYLLHEYLICKVTRDHNRADMKVEKLCRNEFMRRAQGFLFAAQVTDFKSTGLFHKQKVGVTLKMPLRRHLHLQKELELNP